MDKGTLANPDGFDTADSSSCFLSCPLTWLHGASPYALAIPSGSLCKARSVTSVQTAVESSACWALPCRDSILLIKVCPYGVIYLGPRPRGLDLSPQMPRPGGVSMGVLWKWAWSPTQALTRVLLLAHQAEVTVTVTVNNSLIWLSTAKPSGYL